MQVWRWLKNLACFQFIQTKSTFVNVLNIWISASSNIFVSINRFVGFVCSCLKNWACFQSIQPKSNSVCIRECSECSNWCKLKYHNTDSQICWLVNVWRTCQFFNSFNQNQLVSPLENDLKIQIGVSSNIFVLIQ